MNMVAHITCISDEANIIIMQLNREAAFNNSHCCASKNLAKCFHTQNRINMSCSISRKWICTLPAYLLYFHIWERTVICFLSVKACLPSNKNEICLKEKWRQLNKSVWNMISSVCLSTSFRGGSTYRNPYRHILMTQTHKMMICTQ